MNRDQLEQQAEQDRAAVAGTLDELNKRLSPGEIVDQVLHYMEGGGNKFFNNLGKQITANPMPVTLIGAGLAWFLLGKNSSNGTDYYDAPRRYSSTSGQGIGSAARSTGSKIGETAGKIGEMASSAADEVAGSVRAIGEAVEDAASTAYHQAGDRLHALKDSAMAAEERAMAAAKRALVFSQEQPLVLAGIGLAVGAAIGAGLPPTKFEDELLGETSDEVKEAAKDLAVDQLDKAKSLGGKIEEALSQDGQAPREGNSFARDVPRSGSGYDSATDRRRPTEIH